MKKYYSKPEIESVAINTTWALCGLDGSGKSSVSDPTPQPPAPMRRTPAF